MARDLVRIKKQQNISQQGLPDRLQQALNHIKANLDITIKPADKGVNVVVMDNRAYVDMCKRILNNKTWHRRVSDTCATSYTTQFHHIVDRALLSKTVNKDTWD